MDITRAQQKQKISQLRSAVLVATAILMGFIGTTFIDQFMKASSRNIGHNLMGPLADRIYIYECIWFGLSVAFVALLHWGFADWLTKVRSVGRGV
jgi:hypothetical protein